MRQHTLNFLHSSERYGFWPALALLAISLGLFIREAPACAIAHASDTSPADFCLQVDVDITNETGGALTDYPIRFEITASSLAANETLDPRAWDVVPTQGGFGSEVDLLSQDMESNSAAWWTTLDAIADGETQTVTLYMGNDEARRDQGINFTGREVVTVADSALIDNGEVMMEVEIFNTSNTARNQTIFDKWNANTGYELTFIDNAGTLALQWITDDALSLGDECVVNWNSAWSNKWTTINVSFVDAVGSFSEIWIDGVVQVICANGTGAVNGNAIALTIGDGTAGNLTDAAIRDFRLRCCSLVTSDPGDYIRPSQRALHLTFDANKMSEDVSQSNPYSGTVQDQSANNLDGIYSFDRDQTGIIAFVNTPRLTSLTVGAVVDDELVDQTGDLLPDAFTNPGSKQTTNFVYIYVIEPMEEMFDPEWIGPMLFLYALGIGLGLLVGKYTNFQFIVLVVFLFGVPAFIGAVNVWIPWYVVAPWILLVMVTWFGLNRTHKEPFSA